MAVSVAVAIKNIMNKLQGIQVGICFLLGLIFIHCTPTKELVNNTTKPTPTSIIFQQLTCNNLSESMMGFGTLNDETLLLAYFINEQNELILQWNSGYQVFDEEEKLVELADTIQLPAGFHRLLLVLVEQDTERTVGQLDNLIQTNLDFDKLPFVHKIKMQEALKDDDFLDTQVLKIEDLKSKQQITFWGMQLFDEFEYLLDISLVW